MWGIKVEGDEHPAPHCFVASHLPPQTITGDNPCDSRYYFVPVPVSLLSNVLPPQKILKAIKKAQSNSHAPSTLLLSQEGEIFPAWQDGSVFVIPETPVMVLARKEHKKLARLIARASRRYVGNTKKHRRRRKRKK